MYSNLFLSIVFTAFTIFVAICTTYEDGYLLYPIVVVSSLISTFLWYYIIKENVDKSCTNRKIL